MTMMIIITFLCSHDDDGDGDYDDDDDDNHNDYHYDNYDYDDYGNDDDYDDDDNYIFVFQVVRMETGNHGVTCQCSILCVVFLASPIFAAPAVESVGDRSSRLLWRHYITPPVVLQL